MEIKNSSQTASLLEQMSVVESEAIKFAYIHLIIPRSKAPAVMGPGLQEVKQAVMSQGLEAAGPWFTNHHKIESSKFDFKICLPVEGDFQEVGRVKSGTLPPRKIARTEYVGAYEKMGEAWGQFEEWIKENGHVSAPDLWEVYVAGPESGLDSCQFRTQFNRPLLDKIYSFETDTDSNKVQSGSLRKQNEKHKC